MPDHAASPFRLNLEQQRKRAKQLLRAARAGDDAAIARFHRHHPSATIPPTLAEAQFVIARELGAPSWPRLKAHILAMRDARGAMAMSPLDDTETLHIRCGSDLKPTLRDAGFVGDFLEYANPLCQGPVTNQSNWLQRRADFIADAYGALVGRTHAQIAQGLREAEDDLRTAAQRYARIVIWVEHDSYDQLVLTRCLAQFADTPPRQLELISVDQFPGAARFIGLGQLPPEALHLLWRQRKPVTAAQPTTGRTVWRMLRAPDPTPLADAARSGLPALPHLARALHRHCQELPWEGDGLGLTERLALRILADGPTTAGNMFSLLMREREPLPWLGDIMLLHILRMMQRSHEPVFTGDLSHSGTPWPKARLTITETGRSVLAGALDYLSLQPPVRWIGGVCVDPAAPCWRWNETAALPVLTRTSRT